MKSASQRESIQPTQRRSYVTLGENISENGWRRVLIKRLARRGGVRENGNKWLSI